MQLVRINNLCHSEQNLYNEKKNLDYSEHEICTDNDSTVEEKFPGRAINLNQRFAFNSDSEECCSKPEKKSYLYSGSNKTTDEAVLGPFWNYISIILRQKVI